MIQNHWNEIRNGSKQITLTDLLGNAGEPDFSCLQQSSSIATSFVSYAVEVNGDYAYVAHFSSSKFHIYDISDESNPVLVGNNTFASNIGVIRVAGSYAYLLKPNELLIVDVSDPSNATQVGNIGLGLATGGLDISGNYAYVTSSFQNNMQVVDISNPASPSLLTSFGIGDPRSIRTVGDYAYIVSFNNNNLSIVNISNPGSPSIAGTLSLPGNNPTQLSVSGGLAFVINNSTDSLDIIDISQPSNPTKKSTIYIGPSPYDVDSEGAYAFITDYSSEEFKVVNASDPTNPMIVSTLSTGIDPIAIAFDNGRACIIDDSENQMRVYQIICPISIFSFNPLANSFEVLESFPTDNLGNHTASENIKLNSNWLSNDGDNEGISVADDGKIGMGTTSPNSNVHVNGSFALPYADTGASSGTYTLGESHHTLRVFNSIGTVALPDPALLPGRVYVLIGSNGIATKTITVGGSGIIYDDVSNTTINTLSSNQRIKIQSDGTNWIVIGN